MIIKGRSRTDGGALGNYLLSEGQYAKNREENERIEVWEGQGLAEGVTLQTLLHSFERSADITQCEKPLYHVQMRSAEGEHLRREQWFHSVNTLEAKLGLTGQERVIVAHTKDGQDHVHVVWNRVDYERGQAVELAHDARKRLDVARELENELGLRKLGMERGGKLSAKEEAFALRHGKDAQQIKDIIQTCWQHAENGKEFTAHLASYGMTLAKGDTRGYLAVDREGDFYLVSRTTGSREKEVRAKLGDIDREQLPTLQQARDQAKERQSAGLLPQQQTDRNRLEVKQARNLERLDARLSAQADMRDRLQQTGQEDRAAQQRRRAGRLGATLYDRADLVSMQRDAMRDLRARLHDRDRQERQAQAQQRRTAGQTTYQQTAYERLEERHKRQTDRLEVQQYLDRQRAGVVDPERDRRAARLLTLRQFGNEAAQVTLTAANQRQAQRERQTPERGQERTPETTADRATRLSREGRTGGKELTAREKRQQALEFARQQAALTRTDGGRERTRDR